MYRVLQVIRNVSAQGGRVLDIAFTAAYLPPNVYYSLGHTHSKMLIWFRYAETIDMLYSRNAFIISDMYIMEYLRSLLLGQRISQIRSLSVNWELVNVSPYDQPTN